MAFFKKIILLVVLFVLVGIVTTFFGDFSPPEGKKKFQQINFPIPGWQEREITSSEAVLDTLRADTTVFSDYFRPGSQGMNLYIGYYATLDKSKLSHAPQVCYTSQGWVMKENDKVGLELNGSLHTVNRLVLEIGERRILVYYWYQAGRDVYADLFKMKMSLLFDKIRAVGVDSQGNAFIRISTSVTAGEEAAHQQLQEYAQDLVPELKRIFLRSKQSEDNSPHSQGEQVMPASSF